MTARYALLISMALALGLLLATEAPAQDRQVAGATVVEATAGERGAVVLRHFDLDDSSTILQSANGGFVFGTNGWGDLGKGVAFDVPGDIEEPEVTAINIYVFRNDSPVLQSYEVNIYEGDAESGPGALIDGQAFDIGHIDVLTGQEPVEPTEHEFATHIPVDASFVATIQWGAGHGPEDLGILATVHEAGPPSPYEWEQWDDEGWRSVMTSWTNAGTQGWIMWMEAVLVDAAVTTEPGAEPRTITLSSVYPNPAMSTSHIRLDAATGQHVTVEVFNLLGQRVSSVFDGRVPAGSTALDVNAADLVPGIYVVRVVGEDFSQSRKFVVAH